MLTPTVDNLNKVLKLGLHDPIGKTILARDWREFIAAHFQLNADQKQSVATASGLPQDRVAAIQEAITDVANYGGDIRLSGTDPMLLVIRAANRDRSFSCTIEINSFKCHVEF